MTVDQAWEIVRKLEAVPDPWPAEVRVLRAAYDTIQPGSGCALRFASDDPAFRLLLDLPEPRP